MHKGVNTTMDEGQTMVVQARTGGDFDEAMPLDTTQVTSKSNRSRPKAGDPRHPLASGAHAPAIAFSAKDHGGDAGDIAPTLRAGGHSKSHANAGVMPAVAFQTRGSNVDVGEISGTIGTNADRASGGAPMCMNLRGRAGGAMPECDDVANIRAASGGSSRSYVAATAVRRLTPRECERLQGFPDSWTAVPYRGKPAADGPRYKALGNSFAVPVVRWIGSRIAQVDKIP